MSTPYIYPRRGLHGEVVHTIGLQIVNGDLKPGDPLPPEDELTSDLSVSRTVLREAVRVLAAKGLVQARPKTGTRVRERGDWNILDPDVLSWRTEASDDHKLYEETTEIRLAIEPLAARLAATRATDEEVAVHDLEPDRMDDLAVQATARIDVRCAHARHRLIVGA